MKQQQSVNEQREYLTATGRRIVEACNKAGVSVRTMAMMKPPSFCFNLFSNKELSETDKIVGKGGYTVEVIKDREIK